MKTLILVKSTKDYFFDWFLDQDIHIQSLFRKQYSELGVRSARVMSELRFLSKKMYGEWFRNVNEYDKIIVFDTCIFFDRLLLRRIKSLARTRELYVYGWNIDYSEDDYKLIKSMSTESNFVYYSYDKNICARYGLNFNTIMYDRNLQVPKYPIEQEVLFVGKGKTRFEDILAIKSSLNLGNITAKIIVIDDINETPVCGVEIARNYINYKDYISLIAKSNVILDVTQENQTGFSMRVMEALFLGKKLITTNTEVCSSPIYRTGNVYIYDTGNPDINSLRQFICRPLVPYPREIIEYYSVQNWVSRFQISSPVNF